MYIGLVLQINIKGGIVMDLSKLYPGFAGKYKKALVLGTGGGNDIVSALIPALHLQQMGIETDLAGMLSPAAEHQYGIVGEKEINWVGRMTCRWIENPRDRIQISFIDGLLPAILAEKEIDIGKVFNFSAKFGTRALQESLDVLIQSEGYDLVVGVDVGGDILARGSVDETILSPLMDWTALYLLGRLSVDSYLIEFGLGTDGELRPEGMMEIFNEMYDKNLIVGEDELARTDEAVVIFQEVYSEIAKVRHGQTAKITIDTLENTRTDRRYDYHFFYKLKMNGKLHKWKTPYKVFLPGQFNRRIWLVDVKRLARMRKKIAFGYSTVLEQFLKLKKICPKWKTELDLFYYRMGFDLGEWIFLLVPSTRISLKQRSEIINYAGKMGEDLTLILDRDWELVKNKTKFWTLGVFHGFRLLYPRYRLTRYANWMEKLI